MSVTLRRATAEDAAAIQRVAEDVRFDPVSGDGERGYLFHIRSLDEYEACLQVSPLTVVAECSAGIVGFLMALPYSHDGRMVTLIDQLAVARLFAGAGIGAAMYDYALEALRPERMLAEVMHQPVRNSRSSAFFAARGFVPAGESEQPPCVWGLYEWSAADA